MSFVATLGPLRVRGAFRELHGSLVLPAADIERATISIDVLAESIHTGLPMRDRHLRGTSFLDAARYPIISYRSERVTRENATLHIDGTTSLCGVERLMRVRLPVAWGEHQGVAGELALRCDLSVFRSDFGVGFPRGLDLLNPIFLAIGEEVRIGVEVTVPATRMLPALLPALGR